MKAARLVAPKQFDFVELDMPQAGDGQCLIKLERVSVCGSDIRHGYGPIEPEEHYPMVPGRPCHELAGVIVESRTDAYHEGQRVIVIPESGTGGPAGVHGLSPRADDSAARRGAVGRVGDVPAAGGRCCIPASRWEACCRKT